MTYLWGDREHITTPLGRATVFERALSVGPKAGEKRNRKGASPAHEWDWTLGVLTFGRDKTIEKKMWVRGKSCLDCVVMV